MPYHNIGQYSSYFDKWHLYCVRLCITVRIHHHFFDKQEEIYSKSNTIRALAAWIEFALRLPLIIRKINGICRASIQMQAGDPSSIWWNMWSSNRTKGDESTLSDQIRRNRNCSFKTEKGRQSIAKMVAAKWFFFPVWLFHTPLVLFLQIKEFIRIIIHCILKRNYSKHNSLIWWFFTRFILASRFRIISLQVLILSSDRFITRSISPVSDKVFFLPYAKAGRVPFFVIIIAGILNVL